MSIQEHQPIFNVIGGDKSVQSLVDRFYHYMDTLDEAKDIRAQHQADLSEANSKLYMFLSGWLGGPDLYIQKFGHPRLRARHLPFKIGEKERDQWMLCMRKALDDMPFPEESKSIMDKALYRLADHMRNQNESST